MIVLKSQLPDGRWELDVWSPNYRFQLYRRTREEIDRASRLHFRRYR